MLVLSIPISEFGYSLWKVMHVHNGHSFNGAVGNCKLCMYFDDQ